MKKLLMSAAALAMSGSAALAETTIDWLHLQAVPEYVAIMEGAAREFEALNPDVKIQLQFLENEAYKAKLPTLLQSDAAPDIFYSLGGGTFTEQQQAGVLRTIDDVELDETLKNLGPAAVTAYTRDGQLYGLAESIVYAGLWVNKPLIAEAGVTLEDLETWDGFLESVVKLKEADITPITMGGLDRWPAHFYWSYLVIRLAGQDAFEAAERGEGEGFAAPAFVEAGEKFLDLVELEPFQDGFLAANYNKSAGYFGDGKAAFHLNGSWNLGVMRNESASGEGLADEDMAFLPFPSVEGGAGRAGDTLGGINGWVFHKDAPDIAVEFGAYLQTAEVQQRFAAAGAHIPLVAGGSDTIESEFLRDAAKRVAEAQWHAIFFDQQLGADVGSVVNDVSLELADQSISPQEAAEIVQEAWEDNL